MFSCLIWLQVHRFTIEAVFQVSTTSREGLHLLSFTHLFWIWTIQTRGTTFVLRRWNIPAYSVHSLDALTLDFSKLTLPQISGIILGANFSPVGYFSQFFSKKKFTILHFLKPCFTQFWWGEIFFTLKIAKLLYKRYKILRK